MDASIFVPDDGLELHATEAEGRVTFDADDPSTGFLNGIKSYFFYPNCQMIVNLVNYCNLHTCFLNWPNPASFCLFSFFSHDKYSRKSINYKSIDGVLGTRTRGNRMAGSDESTELWQHPIYIFVKHDQSKL